MNAAAAARVTAWNIVLEEDMPVGTKVTVEDDKVTIHPRGGQPISVPYTPEDTNGSLHRALKTAAQTALRAAH